MLYSGYERSQQCDMWSRNNKIVFEVCDEVALKPFSGPDPGFLERGFICKKWWGFALMILSHFFNIP